MADVIPTAQTLPDGFCPETFQEQLEAYAAAMRVTLPTDWQIVVSETTPDPSDQGKIWFEIDANGKVIAIKSWDTSVNEWITAEDIPYYFQDIGTDSAVEITTGENITSLLDIVGRLFLIRIANANTTNSVTIKVDTTAATGARKFGSVSLQAGDFDQDQIAAVVYDGTFFQVFSAFPQHVATPVYATSAAAIIGNTDIAFTKSATETWDEIELDAIVDIDDNGSGGNQTAALTWRTGVETGNALDISTTEGCSNIAQSFSVNNTDDAVICKWMYKGVVPSTINSENTITVRLTVSSTGGIVISGYFIGKATAL